MMVISLFKAAAFALALALTLALTCISQNLHMSARIVDVVVYLRAFWSSIFFKSIAEKHVLRYHLRSYNTHCDRMKSVSVSECQTASERERVCVCLLNNVFDV
jgi:hypothetical protein